MTINKNAKLILAIIIIVIIIAGYFSYDYYQKQKRTSEINDYKKGFFNGMVCEYSCPMVLQNISNKTQMLPELECIMRCVNPFKEKYAKFSYKKEELEKDDLLKDINATINDCKKASMNISKLSLDNVAYFNCTAKSLTELKANYSYLK